MRVEDLGILPYRDAWTIQERIHEDVANGAEERILLVEHPPVITFGRRAGVEKHLLAPRDQLDKLGVDIVQSDRGGDITFHGPGQLVAYPIVRLIDHGLSVGSYVRTLEQSVIAAAAEMGVSAGKDACAVGVWIDRGGVSSKLCAIGVRIRRGVSLHGLALNVTTDLNFFNLIVPCGLTCRAVTSLQQLLGDAAPPMSKVKEIVAKHLIENIRSAKTPQRSETVPQ